MTSESNNIYAECKNIKREQPVYVINEEIAKEIGRNYRTLPTFEKGLYEHLYTKHYSLQRNQYLKCRWEAYKHNIEKRIFAPFQFPDHRDLHFNNGTVRFEPSLSLHNMTNLGKMLKPGPGVDYGGQMPIPSELQMKRGTVKTNHKGVKDIKKTMKRQRNK